MLIRGVLVVELVLNQAGELAELGDVFSQQIHLVHRSQDRRDVAALVHDFQEGRAHVLVVDEAAVHQPEFAADQLRQIRMQLQSTLLRVQKNAHQTARLVLENTEGGGADLPVDELETIDGLRRRFLERGGNETPEPAEVGKQLCFRQQSQPLLQRARNEKNIAHVIVQIAHELLDPLAGRAVGITKVGGHRRLERLGQRVRGKSWRRRLVMHLIADTEEEVVGSFELLAFGGVDEFPLLHLLHCSRAILEKRHPVQVLHIAQASASILDVRLLHGGGVAVLAAPFGLIGHSRRDVIVHESINTL